MAKTDFKSVNEYIAAQPKAARPVLRRVRAIIRKAVPRAIESISYQMPAYRIPEGGLPLRFPFNKPVPAGLIARVAKLRAKEVVRRAKAKALGKKGR